MSLVFTMCENNSRCSFPMTSSFDMITSLSILNTITPIRFYGVFSNWLVSVYVSIARNNGLECSPRKGGNYHGYGSFNVVHRPIAYNAKCFDAVVQSSL